MTEVQSRLRTRDESPTIPSDDRRAPQVKVWACLGAASATLVIVGWTRWVLSDDFAATPSGPDHFSSGGVAYLRSLEVISTLAALAFVWHCLVRPLLREFSAAVDDLVKMSLLVRAQP